MAASLSMEQVTKEGLISRIVGDRERFEVVLARVPRSRLVEPALPGGWSVKDVLAHIAWGEREAVGVMRARALVGSDLWHLSQDERNAAVVRESAPRGVDDVMRDFEAVFDEFVNELERLSDEELNEPERIRGLAEAIPGWRPWRVLYDPDHYEDHARVIEAHLPTLADVDHAGGMTHVKRCVSG